MSSDEALQQHKRVLIDNAWRSGNLAYLLLPHQYAMYAAIWKAIDDPGVTKFGLNVSRQTGKTSVLVLVNIEFSLRHPGSQQMFAFPVATDLKKVVKPIMDMFLKDCPDALRPRLYVQESVIKFPNGSMIHLSGTDKSKDKLRGPHRHLSTCDETGFMSDLRYIVDSILIPQFKTTNGTLLMSSTPPVTPDHDWTTLYRQCEELGNNYHQTIYDDTSLSEERLNAIIADYADQGGVESTEFRREYLAEFVVEDEYALVREWKEEYARSVTLQNKEDEELFGFYHKYTAMDIGYVDLTAVLYGYYDFRTAALVIQDETSMNRMSTRELSEEIRDKERELWGAEEPYMRIADNNAPIMLKDLSVEHDLHFSATDKKDSLEAMLNKVREWIHNKRVIIHPRCKKLIGSLKYGVWDNKHKAFARSKAYGHYDHLAALLYLVRNVDEYSNPIPRNFGVVMGPDHFTYDFSATHHTDNEGEADLAEIFRYKGAETKWHSTR